jgi:hypothetical protein
MNQGSSSKPISGLDATNAVASNRGATQAQGVSRSQIQTSVDDQTSAVTLPLGQGTSTAALTGSNPLSMATDASSYQPAASSAAVKADAENASITGAVRSVHGTSNANSVEVKSRLEAKASSPSTASAIVDSSAMAGGAADANGVVSRTRNSTETSATATADASDTFAALDAGGAEGRTTWIHAGAQQAEAGYQDSTLGWVSVRANASGGSVHAELAAGSADAAQALGSHMAGLSAYLAEHHTPVETLTVTAPEPGLSSGQSADQGMQQGAGQQTGQEMAQNTGSGSASTTISPAATSALPTSQTEWDASASPAGPGSAHISVMA